MTLAITTYAPAHPGTGDPRRVIVGERHVIDRDTLVAWLRDPDPLPAAGKHDLPLVVAATFVGDRRLAAATEHVTMLGIDDDTPTADPRAWADRVRTALGGVEVYVYSTASSEPGAYRMRALVPYDAPASAADHRASWRVARDVLARVGIEIDRACCDPSRGYYPPAAPPSRAYAQCHLTGAPWPVAHAARAELARQAREAETEERARRARPGVTRATQGNVIARARAYLSRVDAAIAGANGHTATLTAAIKLVRGFGLDAETAYDLLASHYNPRCRPPWPERELRRKVDEAASDRMRAGTGWLVERERA